MGVSSNLLSLCVVLLLACSGMGRKQSPRKEVAVEGSVYCSYCQNQGGTGYLFKTDLLPGAVVKLQCNNTNKGWEEETTTDSNGGFVFRPTKVSTWGAHKCKVFLVSSGRSDCPIINSLNDGDSGAVLKPAPANKTASSQLFTVGPFGFFPDYHSCGL